MRRGSRRPEGESGQTLVEYALIIALIALAAIVALGFLSGRINSLFSKAGNSLDKVTVASGPAGPPGPPASGTTFTGDPDGAGGPLPNSTYTWVSPGPAHTSGSTSDCGNSDAACSGHDGFYHPLVGSVSGQPSTFTIGGWTFNCTWRTSGSWGSYEAGCW
jgi:Flp pilus assembly pilin Flp